MSDFPFVFRPLAQGDRQLIVDFFARLDDSATAFFNLNRGNERRTLEFFENGKPDHRFFLTEDTAAPAPTAAALCFIWDIDRKIPWLGIAAADGYRGRHIGSFTLDALLGRLEAEGYGGALLRTAKANLPAQRLYESRGFERLGEHPSGEYLYLKRFFME